MDLALSSFIDRLSDMRKAANLAENLESAMLLEQARLELTRMRASLRSRQPASGRAARIEAQYGCAGSCTLKSGCEIHGPEDHVSYACSVLDSAMQHMTIIEDATKGINEKAFRGARAAGDAVSYVRDSLMSYFMPWWKESKGHVLGK